MTPLWIAVTLVLLIALGLVWRRASDGSTAGFGSDGGNSSGSSDGGSGDGGSGCGGGGCGGGGCGS